MKKIEKLVIVKQLIVLCALLFLVSCQTMKKADSLSISQAETASKESLEKKYDLNLAVVPLAEKRGVLKKYGSVYTYLIPLVPYGTIRYERPDQARMFNTQDEFEFNMSENLLDVVVAAIRGSNLFNNVILTAAPLESKADLILSGDLYSTLYEGKTYSYGISFLGPALWCFGLPAGSSHKKLGLSLYLKKIDTGELVWSYDINKEKTVIQGLYHNWGKNVNSFVGLMEDGVKEAILDMQQKLAEIPLEKIKTKKLPPADVQQQTVPLLEEKKVDSSAKDTPTITSATP